jgi:sulfonate transport system substrate-binding protein
MPRLLADAKVVVGNRACYFSLLENASRNMDVTKILIDELNAVDQWGAVNKGDLATELAGLWGIPKPVVDVSVGRSAFGTAPIAKAILAEQQGHRGHIFRTQAEPQEDQCVRSGRGRGLTGSSPAGPHRAAIR